MPTVTPTQVKAYAHCPDALCSGYHQEEIDAIREETAWTYAENGGDGIFAPFVERSIVSFKFADPEDAACHSCGRAREVSGEPRPVYQALSGYDPMFLVNSSAKFDPSMRNTQEDYENAQLDAANAKIEALEGKLNQLLDALSEEK